MAVMLFWLRLPRLTSLFQLRKCLGDDGVEKVEQQMLVCHRILELNETKTVKHRNPMKVSPTGIPLIY